MFKNMKPLPKMILIGLFVGGAVFGYTKFVPKTTEVPVEAAQVEAVAERAVPTPVEAPVVPASQVAPVVQAPAEAVTPTVPQPVNSPVAQSAGLDALLNLGAKK